MKQKKKNQKKNKFIQKITSFRLTKKKARNIFFLELLSLFLLFYPGNNYYAHFFSYNRELFAAQEKISEKEIRPIPYVKNTYVLPNISAQGGYIVDSNSATPVFEKNKDTRFFPASTTKIITALVSLDIYKPTDVLTVKRVITEGQVVGVVQGEKLRVHELLYGLLVHSGNDVAYVLADNYKGGYDRFVELMNKKAAELGMKNSHFTNPAGLDNPDQYTTPFDLSIAGRKLLQNELLSTIVSTPSITISDVDFVHFHILTNVNKLLGKIPGIGGLKTGYTEVAGENLVTFYKRNGHQFLIVIMKSEDRFYDTEAIVHWIDANVGFVKI